MPSPNGISDCSIDIGITTSKPGHRGAAFQDRSQDAADFAGPGQHRRSLERRGASALLVDRDDDGS
jgi:hypothetical protein